MRKTGYLEKYDFYAQRYGVSLRTVKNWGALSAPLDVPEKMLPWWEKCMKQRPPDSILQAAAQKPVEKVIELPLEPEKVIDDPPPVLGTSGSEFKEVADDEMGIVATQKRLRNVEVMLYRAYKEAVLTQDEGKIRTTLRNWNDVSDQVRIIAKAAREDEIARRDLIPRVEAEMRLVELHSGIYSALRGAWDQVSRVFGVPKTPDNETRWLGILDEVCHALKNEVFTNSPDAEE